MRYVWFKVRLVASKLSKKDDKTGRVAYFGTASNIPGALAQMGSKEGDHMLVRWDAGCAAHTCREWYRI